MKNLNERQLEKLGEMVVDTFSLKKAKGYDDRYQTEWGTKTAFGIGCVVLRLVDEVTL